MWYVLGTYSFTEKNQTISSSGFAQKHEYVFVYKYALTVFCYIWTTMNKGHNISVYVRVILKKHTTCIYNGHNILWFWCMSPLILCVLSFSGYLCDSIRLSIWFTDSFQTTTKRCVNMNLWFQIKISSKPEHSHHQHTKICYRKAYLRPDTYISTHHKLKIINVIVG